MPVNIKNTMELKWDQPGKPWYSDPNVRGYLRLRLHSTGTMPRPFQPLRRFMVYVRILRAKVAQFLLLSRLLMRCVLVQATADRQLQRNVLLLPMGRSDDGAHSTNEKVCFTVHSNGSLMFRIISRAHSCLARTCTRWPRRRRRYCSI